MSGPDETPMPLVPLTGVSPAAPPAVKVADVVLTPLSYYWIVDGQPSADEPTSSEGLTVPEAPVWGDSVTFEVGDGGVPIELTAHLFRDLDDDGQPTDHGRAVDCLRDDTCTVEERAVGYDVTVRLEHGEEMATLTMLYPVRTEDVEDRSSLPPFMHATFAVRLA